MIHDPEGNYVPAEPAPATATTPPAIRLPAPAASVSPRLRLGLDVLGLVMLAVLGWTHVVAPLGSYAVAHNWPVVSTGPRLDSLEKRVDKIDPVKPPGPAPAPKPAPLGKLYAVLIYKAGADAPKLAADPAVRDALAALDVEWFASSDADARVDRSLIALAGALPALLVYDAPDSPSPHYRDLAGAVVAKDRARLDPPKTADEIISAFKRLRGAK